MAIIGYARTSTREQEAGLQADYSSTVSIPGAVDIIEMPGHARMVKCPETTRPLTTSRASGSPGRSQD